MDAGDATGLLGTAVGLGAGLLFTGMMLNYTKDMTEQMIDKGKKQGRGQRKAPKRRQTQPNFFSAKNLNKPFRY
jgi:hypothetical protein